MTDISKSDETLHEQLSALIDGEADVRDLADVDQMLEQVCCDDRCRQAWQNFHLTRDVMQKDYHSALSANFCELLSSRLGDEETYSEEVYAGEFDAPGINASRIKAKEIQVERDQAGNIHEQTFSGAQNIPPAGESTVVPFADLSAKDTSTNALARSNRRWKSVAVFGMAASVAMAAVVASQLLGKQNAQTAGSPLIARLPPGSATADAGAPTNSNALTGAIVPAVLSGGGLHWRDSGSHGHALKVEQRLNSYLTNHLEDAAMGKVHGMISHTRVVGYDSRVLESEAF